MNCGRTAAWKSYDTNFHMKSMERYLYHHNLQKKTTTQNKNKTLPEMLIFLNKDFKIVDDLKTTITDIWEILFKVENW